MNISKALKVKNRLIGEVNRLQEIVRRENSRRDDNPSTVDVENAVLNLEATRIKLIALKGEVNKASAPISGKLAMLGEIKSQINFYNSLPTREGEELTLIGANREKLSFQWKAFFNKEKIDLFVKSQQEIIDQTQDEIDDFNARTQVNFTE